MILRIDFDEFLSWLASHSSDEVIGRPGLCFNSPLAAFLSYKAGRVTGEDGLRYGYAALESYHWRELPQWARLFSQLGERFFCGRPLRAVEVLDLLIQVETALAPAAVLVA